jgi:hypothetical protein
MTQELTAELYQRYMRGELTLDDAAEQIFARSRRTGGAHWPQHRDQRLERAAFLSDPGFSARRFRSSGGQRGWE